MMKSMRPLLAAALVSAAFAGGAGAQQPISLRDSFRLGSGAGVLCSAQLSASDKAATGMSAQESDPLSSCSASRSRNQGVQKTG